MLRVPQATPNCFVYLETGILPIEHEIRRRQFTFLHHIVNLDCDDPVKAMYIQMRDLPEELNWANSIESMKVLYDIQLSDEQIQEMDILNFKDQIQTKINTHVFNLLKSDCATKTKTKHLIYTTFSQQPYITRTPPKLMYHTVRIRCSMLNTIYNRPYMFKGVEKCRLCGLGDESLVHIINCFVISDKIQAICPSIYTDEIDYEYVKELASYVVSFYEEEEEMAEE